MSGHFGAPGIGGSLGLCALCGENFTLEIITGRSVKSFKQAGSDQTFYAHDKCLEDSASCKTLLDLPEKSPLRQIYERQEGIGREPVVQPIKETVEVRK